MSSAFGPYRVVTTSGPLDVYVNNATTAHVHTPSNWGTYPELRTTLNGRAVFGIAVYFERTGWPSSEEWDVRPYSQANGFGAYVSRTDNRTATLPQIQAAVRAARTALDALLLTDPGVLARADAAQRAEQRERLAGELRERVDQVNALAAQLEALDDDDDEPAPVVDTFGETLAADAAFLAAQPAPETLDDVSRALVAYYDSCDLETGGSGELDTSEICYFVERIRAALS